MVTSTCASSELAPLPFTATGASSCVALLPTHVLNRATRLVIRLDEQRDRSSANVGEVSRVSNAASSLRCLLRLGAHVADNIGTP